MEKVHDSWLPVTQRVGESVVVVLSEVSQRRRETISHATGGNGGVLVRHDYRGAHN